MSVGLFKYIKRCSRGATMVEFAFAAPIIFFLTFAFFEFCLVLFTQSILYYSAEEATRYAMVKFEPGNLNAGYLEQIKLEIKDHAKESFILIDEDKISKFDVDVVVDPDDMTKTVSVTIEYDYSMIMPFMSHSPFKMIGKSESFLVQ